MAKKTVENEEIIVGQNPIEKYQKPLTYIGTALIVITLGYVGFTRFYLEPKQTEAAAEMFMAEKWFGKDSFALALRGATFLGFEDIADQYGLTDAGNMANYYAGICHLKIGANSKDSVKAQEHFEDAVSYLKKFSTDSKILGPMGLGATGDALCELGEYDEAASYYAKAAAANNNEYTAPMYLKKAGLVYEKLGKNDKALASYQKIKDQYGKTTIGLSIDKYISRAANR
ncbi:tetratricopeptide repeat protein [bacterium]|nr:tetratricopeptide repeat protein [bacterium]